MSGSATLARSVHPVEDWAVTGLQTEVDVRVMTRVGGAIAVLWGAFAPALAGQVSGSAATEAYFGAVAEYFVLPRSEVSILGDWRLPAEEIPVVLFVARRAGVSPEAVVALRGAGRGWAELTVRYRLDATQFHVPLPESANAGALEDAYRRFRSTPAGRWKEVVLTDADIVGLVNLRVLSETLRRSPRAILAAAVQGSWIERYAHFLAGPPRTP